MNELDRFLGLTHKGEPHEWGEWHPYAETMTLPLPDPFPAKYRRCCIKDGCTGQEFRTEMVPLHIPAQVPNCGLSMLTLGCECAECREERAS